ncbi:Cof-type HAD-IIB family hydrolase [Streptococcus catagoni]|uniref:Cof-type HAD-IIB family hydrolase n=1 Tax=Streptococcus catagoni TaxID=2654874 RepID=UPI00140E2CE2|nr:Cof-type HAD-IIB family hydrolase [Streptococcus catagoni]
MNDVKILALDLDGTLLNSEKIVTDANKAALAAAREKGIKVVITTGRPLAAIEALLEDLDLISDEDYAITFNGGLVQRNTGQILDKTGLSFDQIAYIHKILKPDDLPTDILCDSIVYSISGKNGRKSLYHLANPMLEFIEIEQLEDLPKDTFFNKVVTVTDPDYLDGKLKTLDPDLFNDFESFKSRDIIFELMPKGIHKAFGLQLLCQHLGLEAKNVMAIGDEANDFTMLQWAGLGVAMANGVDDAKNIADKVTSLTNDQSGVAEAIEKYILNGED